MPAHLYLGDSLEHYHSWPSPTAIVSDGAYGLAGFPGDPKDPSSLVAWYEPHVRAWSEHATAVTTLWFWNSEVGWATVHPLLERYGWRYVSCNIWNKGVSHIAGNVNTKTLKCFPKVTEVCAQYVFEAKIAGMLLKQWLLAEWVRAGFSLKRANLVCGVKDAASRKYLDQGPLWYCPSEMFYKLRDYANVHGRESGRPYFSIDGVVPMTNAEWDKTRPKFSCPYGVTNVWERKSVRGKERLKLDAVKVAHCNQKPLDLLHNLIEASTTEGDVVWEPFGGLFSASLAADSLGRLAYACEISPNYFQLGKARFRVDT